jgi:hypothetical protein
MNTTTTGVPGCIFPTKGPAVALDENMLALVAAALDLDVSFYFALSEVADEYGMQQKAAKDVTYQCMQELGRRGSLKAQAALAKFHSISGS